MTSFVFCLSNDLSGDARLYAEANGYEFYRTLADLSRVSNGDILILYAHGQYFRSPKPHGEYKAAKTIDNFGSFVTATDIAAVLLAHLPQLNELELVLHACFSAGTVDRAPSVGRSIETLAGQVCAALRNNIANLTVYGYQGKAKAGRAGYLVDDLIGAATRTTRRQRDPHAGEDFRVGYRVENGAVVIAEQGSAVRWR